MIAMYIFVVVVALFLLWLAWVVIAGYRAHNSPEAILQRKIEARQREALSKGIADLATGIVLNQTDATEGTSVPGGILKTYRDDVLTVDYTSYWGSDYVNSGYVPGPAIVQIRLSGDGTLVFQSSNNDVGAYIPGSWERHLSTISTEASKLAELRATKRVDQEHADKLTRFGLR